MRLKDKVIVITGAGSGMGKSMAQLFAAEGAKVVCADLSGKQDEVAAALGKAAIAVHADVSKSKDVQNMIAAAEKTFGRLDVLCNNAGFGGGLAPLHEQSEELYDNVHAVNLKGVFLGMKYGIMSMLKTGGGAIVNTASAAGLMGWMGHSVYGAAKAGVLQMTKCAALDYATQNIRVNAVCPGYTWTGLVPASATMPEPPADVPLPVVPMRKWGLASDIAYAALYLASDEAQYVTGIAIPVDGGYVAGRHEMVRSASDLR
jgi:NAD(P)-dependent dehydrogenase (short-subunit alcohol dehydrogenase family)